MGKLLVSFCNTPKYCLGLLDLDTDTFIWATPHSGVPHPLGVTGLTKFKDKYVAAVKVKHNEYALIAYNKYGNSDGVLYLVSLAKDLHAITTFENSLIINDTGNDRILQLFVDDDWSQYYYKQIDMPDQVSKLGDVRHINSIIGHKGKLYASMFGLSEGGIGWVNGMNGSVVDVLNKKTIYEGLQHPHSAHVVDEDIFWLESATSKVYKHTKNETEVFAELPGYLRGMTHDDKYLYIAASASRRVSKSKGTLNEIQPMEKYQSWIHILDRKTGNLIVSRNITLLGFEIFEVLYTEDLNFPTREMPAEVERYLYNTYMHKS